MENKEITKEYLETIKFHELGDKFKELGIPDVWDKKSKTAKKADLIKNAISALAKIKAIKNAEPNASDVEVEKKLAVIQADEQAAIVKRDIEKEAEKETLLKDEVKVIKKSKISKEDLLKNISLIDSNLSNNIPGQRDILLQKRATLEKALSEMK